MLLYNHIFMRGNVFFSTSILRTNETIHKVYKQLNCVIYCKKRKIDKNV